MDICGAILDKRFGFERRLSGPSENSANFYHELKKEATDLLIDSLDCLHKAISKKNVEPKISME